MFGICGKINVEKKKMENMFDMINLFIVFFLKGYESNDSGVNK